jgi:hypothetical protein
MQPGMKDVMTSSSPANRYGFYYFPDNIHYRDSDAHAWIPELQALGAAWVTLLASAERAIPETFIRSLVDIGIQPIIHLLLPLDSPEMPSEVSVLFEAYAHWGVQYITLFDRPNQMASWQAAAWAQKNLVDRFLDQFIPLAEAALQAGVSPTFPPLEPGGDYWDTAFLYSALQGLQRRGQDDLLDRLVIAAYAWPGNHSPNWGAGGPERWPASRPYLTPASSEDQRGFRIFDWYLATAEAAIGKSLPIILLAAGSRIGDQPDPQSPAVDAESHARQNMALVRILQGQAQGYDHVAPEVLACNFWVLSAAQGDPSEPDAWYPPGRAPLPAVEMLKEWAASADAESQPAPKSRPQRYKDFSNPRPIAHYLLLPSVEWGQVSWNLEAMQPFIQKYQPTIGFSALEASHARKVTVVGGAGSAPEAIIDGLLAAGCVVEQINADGMNIASKRLSHSAK